MSVVPLILASASPRRAELLRAASIPFEVLAPVVDETVQPGESADAYVRRLSHAKAAATAILAPGRCVLGADTTVVIDEEILGKPEDVHDAGRMLRMLSGRAHTVLTSVCVIAPNGSASVRVESTTVEFAPLSSVDVAWYVSTGEPMDKAGAYAIQGRASRFVTRIEGSYPNVVGLPVALVWKMLRETGFGVRDGLS